MNLDGLRLEIDGIDNEIIKLFQERMDISSQIAKYKKDNNLKIKDPARERAKLADVAAKSRDDMQSYTCFLFGQLFELSRTYQNRLLSDGTELARQVKSSIENTPQVFPKSPMVACQGVEGAYSQLACGKMFQTPMIMYFNNFEGVFSAIDNGLCQYGVIPIENSTAGSVNQVYDLMYRHDFKIIRSARLKVDHNLLVKPGTKMEDIREIYSHQQALSQCSAFLAGLPENVKVIPHPNTAEAAKMVAESDSGACAAISSRSCAELYGLDILSPSIQDKGNNYTRFICISKNLEIYPGADKTSIMLTTPHRPGSLYNVLGKFYELGINLLKLESRPLPDRDFEFMFYFDVKTSIYSEEFIQMIDELSQISDEFRYLGSYSEVIE